MFADLRYVLRVLLRMKGFTAVTVLTLALGLGSAGAIFSTVDWVLFRSLDFPDGLVFVGARDKQGAEIPVIIDAEVQAYQQASAAFSETALAAVEAVNAVVDGTPLETGVLGVSPNFLGVLGVTPAIGRDFRAEEGVPGRNDVVIIGHSLWQRQFAGADDVLGRTLVVDGRACTIIGVLRARQSMPTYFYAEVLRPLVYQINPEIPWEPSLFMLAKLRPGVSPAQAQEQLAALPVTLPPQVIPYFGDRVPAVLTMRDVQKVLRPELYLVLLGAVGFLFGIACFNAANLMMLRMLGRQRELSIRLALGGGRGRLVRLFVLESLVLSLLATAGGLLLANWLAPLFQAGRTADAALQWNQWSLDGRALVVLAGLTFVTSLMIVVVPAWRILRAPLSSGLKDGGAALGESRRLARLRGALVLLQAAFAVILLTGAGLMVRTFERLQEVPLGFDPARLIKANLGFPSGHLTGKEERLALLKRLQEHLQRVPGVTHVAYGTDNVLPGWDVQSDTVQMADGSPVKVKIDYLSSDYLETTGMRLIRGRLMNQTGGEVMINEAFARVRFGVEDPIGQYLKPANAPDTWNGWLVVGILADVRPTVRSPATYRVYGPETWWPPAMTTLMVRAAQAPDGSLISAVRRAIYEVDARLVPAMVVPLVKWQDWQVANERFAAGVLKVLSAIALLLTVVGLFSVLAYTVDRRMNEFGVRLALGATSRNLVMLVLRRGLGLTLFGVVLGLAGAWALSRFLQSLLFETPRHDPVVLGAVSLVLLSAAVVACALPAQRATRVDVARLLRAE